MADNDLQSLVQKSLQDARSAVRAVQGVLASGKQTLQWAAEGLELEARIWAQNLQAAILDSLAMKGLPPEHFDARATESAHEIIGLAADEFSVSCGSVTTNGVTPLFIGRSAGVTRADPPPVINTRGAIMHYLEKALADYPPEYRRRNLAAYTLAHGAQAEAAVPVESEVHSKQGADSPDRSADQSPFDGWIQAIRAPWKEDAELVRECPEFLQPAKSVRLVAIGKLRKGAAEVLQRTRPQHQGAVEDCLWPVFSEYSERLFDSMSEAELGSSRGGSPSAYVTWLKSECLPEVIRDVCAPILSQFQATLRYVVEQVGEVSRPDDLVKLRQVLWHMLAEAVLPERGSPLFRLETRLTNALFEERVPHWEAMAGARGAVAAAEAVRNVPIPVHERAGDSASSSSEDAEEQVVPPSEIKVHSSPASAGPQLSSAILAKQTRAATVAALIKELNAIKPQMFEDEGEYKSLRGKYPEFILFKIADGRPDLKEKVLSIRSSTRHIRLAQELAAARHGRTLSTIQDDWKKFKPAEFKRDR